MYNRLVFYFIFYMPIWWRYDSGSGVTGTETEYLDFTWALYGNLLSERAEGASFLLFNSNPVVFGVCCLWVKNFRIWSIQLESIQLVDSNVKPDTISIVSNASRRKMKEDVMVLVMTAKTDKKATIANINGVNNKQPIVENIKGIISV